jgi:AbrB family looped-hinge helix DNA binding protein
MNYFKVSAIMKNKLLTMISEQIIVKENIYSHGMLFTIMVETVDETLNVDKQGRIVLPAHIRKAIGIERGGKLLIRFDGSRIILNLFLRT